MTICFIVDMYCIAIPETWIDFGQLTFKMPRKTKQLSQARMKQLSCDDWDEFKFHKRFSLYENYSSARSVEKAVSEMSASDDNTHTTQIADYLPTNCRLFFSQL
ncbi:hypothetical protein P5V15_010362 [Pogonomyrmex californicus]